VTFCLLVGFDFSDFELSDFLDFGMFPRFVVMVATPRSFRMDCDCKINLLNFDSQFTLSV
jgi:hypothetical protein